MTIDVAAVRKCLKSFDFETLFREHLGWDNHQAQLAISVNDGTTLLHAVAQKRGFVAFLCASIPDRATRLKIDHQVTKSAREHFIIYADQTAGQQVWQWVRREPGKPLASRDHRFNILQSGDSLIQRLVQIAVSLEEEEKITVLDVTGRARAAFDVDKVTKKFYDRFKVEHAAFRKLITGIQADADLQWYTSLMLNRLMFVYFIQKKGFLNGDLDYLRNRLALVKQAKGQDEFHSFYRYFLVRLFHDGLGKSPDERKLDATLEKLLGKVPYLNGGFFEVHQLEEHNPAIDIPDNAFEKLFDFFDQYSWHLDERPLHHDNEINPDVVGYIFEKYINQKQMGAYYTKEDITEYISKNTIIPFLFDAAEKKCAIAFKPDSALWRLLRDDPDRYIYAAVRHGVVDDTGAIIPLPSEIEDGIEDVAKRDGWNRLAPDPFGLPTETWREHVARRQRCLNIRENLRSGAGVSPAFSQQAGQRPASSQQAGQRPAPLKTQPISINDLITLNLDIWQFARDAIINAEGPELLRAFWHAIEKLTVLDPTCGSGAFLFAALRILETLYSDCLERMERFVEEADSKSGAGSGAGVPPASAYQAGQRPAPHSAKFSDFRSILDQLAKHPNDRYFILKSIIINNLFGVDIMAEAVEICKLRLFLKLVAQVEKVGQIEPLPDIDFNIRAGNTLVGFASLDQVKDSMQGDMIKLLSLPRIEEDAELVDCAYQQFRAQQTMHGGKITANDKHALRERLSKLNTELDYYLAGEYGVNIEKQKAFDAWKSSHEPFHWLVEFYGIMHTGGFDVIIGNPPYVEYSKVQDTYTVLHYKTEQAGNLYAFVMERNSSIISRFGRSGMIIPHSAICTDRMSSVQKVLTQSSSVTWISTYCIRPAKLFVGVDQRLCIYVTLHEAPSCNVFASRYHRWHEEYRPFLLKQVQHICITRITFPNSVPKIHIPFEVTLWQKIKCQASLGRNHTGQSVSKVFYHNAPRYWIRAMDFAPYFWNERDGEQVSTQVKSIVLPSTTDAAVAVAALNSSLFYWWFLVLSDCRHLNMREIENFPLGLERMSEATKLRLAELSSELMTDLKRHKYRKECQYKATGKVIYDEFYPKHSKAIIDEIDRVLAKHYDLTDEELDFIINYDIKYRMGGADEEQED